MNVCAAAYGEVSVLRTKRKRPMKRTRDDSMRGNPSTCKCVVSLENRDEEFRVEVKPNATGKPMKVLLGKQGSKAVHCGSEKRVWWCR